MALLKLNKDKTYFVHPEDWWTIYQAIFRCDPNSLVHGVMFAREQIRISRLLTAHLEAFGAARVGRSGVKFDRLGKTTSGQPIFSVYEETAREIRATFILDLVLLRSYGRGDKGLNETQKRLLLELALWKVQRLLKQPFRYRTQCYLACSHIEINTEKEAGGECLPALNLNTVINGCNFENPVTRVYYPADELFKFGKDEEDSAEASDGIENEE